VGLDSLQPRPDPTLIKDGNRKGKHLLFIQNVAYILQSIQRRIKPSGKACRVSLLTLGSS
jgi:hypothetical protein